MRPLALVGVTRHQHDRQIRMVPRDLQGKRNSIHDRHLDISQDEIVSVGIFGKNAYGFSAVAGRRDGMTIAFQRAADKFANRPIIFGKQDLRHLGLNSPDQHSMPGQPDLLAS